MEQTISSVYEWNCMEEDRKVRNEKCGGHECDGTVDESESLGYEATD